MMNLKDLKVKWCFKGKFNETVNFYEKSNFNLNEEQTNQRRKLIKSLKGNLLDPSQESLLKTIDEDTLIFENGGTFGYVLNNFPEIIYADAVATELNNKNKKAVCFTIIDPTDISRFERTLNLAGKSMRLQLNEIKTSGLPKGPLITGEEIELRDYTSTKLLLKPKREHIEKYLDRIKKIIDDYNFGLRTSDKDKNNMLNNFDKLKNNIIHIFNKSNTFRDLTNLLYIELLKPLTKNSIFITLKQWQERWNLEEKLSSRSFYELTDRTYSQLNKQFNSSLNLYHIQGNIYRFPFRIDDGKVFHKTRTKEHYLPVINILTGNISYYSLNDKKIVSEIMNISNIKNVDLLPLDGLLYAFDYITYNAIPLTFDSIREFSGYVLGALMNKSGNLPALCAKKFNFYSIGRQTKKSPKLKASGVLGAYIEGLNADFFRNVFRKNEDNIKSKMFEKYGQKMY